MQNTLQQLDLFGMPIGVQPEPKKNVSAVKITVIPPPQQKAAIIAPAAAVVPPQAFRRSVATETNTTVVNEQPLAIIKPSQPVGAKPPGKRGRKSFKEIDSEIGLLEIPDENVLKQKLYYSISEVAGWFKVNTSLIRYWENEFDIVQPRKTRKGDRLFRVEDIHNLRLIYHLLRERKFSIEGAKHFLKNQKQKADAQLQITESLTRFRFFLLELKASL